MSDPTPPVSPMPLPSPWARGIVVAVFLTGIGLIGVATVPTCTPAQVAVIDLGADAVSAICAAMQAAGDLTDPIEIAVCAAAKDVPTAINNIATVRADKMRALADAGVDASVVMVSGSAVLLPLPAPKASR